VIFGWKILALRGWGWRTSAGVNERNTGGRCTAELGARFCFENKKSKPLKYREAGGQK